MQKLFLKECFPKMRAIQSFYNLKKKAVRIKYTFPPPTGCNSPFVGDMHLPLLIRVIHMEL